MIGQTLSHYRILGQIGAGGMGVVYRAHDERLDRDVAIKVLPPGTLADESARKRLRKEALALAKLNHPNIATIHDFDTQDGNDFLVMEHVSGVTLAEKLASGALPEREVVSIGTQIAQTLEDAHEQGIVHRDLKPGNVMVTARGRVKLLDFGLAKVLRPSDTAATESMPELGGPGGTLPYMAPEQFRGSMPDARSDIYALGVVLYEMATGQRPFTGTVATALIADILGTAPSPPGRFQPRLSPKLEQVILKCLEKEPEARYQSAKELAVDLRSVASRSALTAVAPKAPGSRLRAIWLGAGAVLVVAAIVIGLGVGGLRERFLGARASTRIESVAVLPLQNFSRDPEQDYFADGMTDELITSLAKIRKLRVTSRTSVMQYRGSKKSLREIAKELRVDAVLEGSVQRSGDRVRVTAQLIRAADDTHLWADSYDRDLRDVLTLESEVAKAIAQQVKAELSPEEQVRLSGSAQVDPEAYQLYLRGLHAWNLGPGAGAAASQKLFQQAITKDPKFTLAYAWLAFSYDLNGEFQLAKEPARKAMQLDDSLAMAHSALALAMFNGDWDFAGAEREFRRALELGPNDTMVLDSYPLYLSAIGKNEQAIAMQRRALEQNPLSALDTANLGGFYMVDGRLTEAESQLKSALEIDPNFAYAHAVLAAVYEEQGQYERAAAEYRKVGKEYGEDFQAWATAHVYATQGRKAEALQLLQELGTPRLTFITPSYSVADVYARLGDKDQAFAWLEKAYSQHAADLVELKVDPDLAGLRSDPRFGELVRRVGLPE